VEWSQSSLLIKARTESTINHSTAHGPGQRQASAPFLSRHDERGARMSEDWPLRSYLELGVLPGAVPCARLHARQVLWEWGLSEFSDSVELLVSELVTNAVQASQSMEDASSVRLWLRSDKNRVLILVWDRNSRSPVRIDAAENAENGRGLLLVEAMSDRWHWYRPEDWDGKIVWAEISPESPDELPRRIPGDYR
jgi:anti-sigma regulatory factor (Ser/Thr protein kinase)